MKLTLKDLKLTPTFLSGCAIILIIGFLTKISYAIIGLVFFIILDIINIYVDKNSSSLINQKIVEVKSE